jgi:hypothetical protein
MQHLLPTRWILLPSVRWSRRETTTVENDVKLPRSDGRVSWLSCSEEETSVEKTTTLRRRSSPVHPAATHSRLSSLSSSYERPD